VEDRVDNGQAKEVETETCFSGDQLQKQKGVMNSPKSRYSQSCRRSHRISRQLVTEGNSIPESEVECGVIEIPTGELRTSTHTSTVEQRNNSSVFVPCVASSCKEACRQSHIPLPLHNSKTFVQDQGLKVDAVGSESRVDIQRKRSSDTSSVIQTPLDVYSGPLTYPDSTSKRSGGGGVPIERSEVECEVAETSELRGSFSCTGAEYESEKMEPKGRKMSLFSECPVLCINKKGPRQNCSLLPWHDVKHSVQDERMELSALGNDSAVDMPKERSSPTCALVQSSMNAVADTVLTHLDSTSKAFEDGGNFVIESEIQPKAVETSVRDVEVSFFSTAVKCGRGRMRPEKRNMRSCCVPCNSKEASNRTPLCEQNSKPSAPNKKVQVHVNGMEIPVGRPSMVSPLICGISPLVTFPDSMVKKCSTDHYCHSNIENLEVTTGLTEQERNVTVSENVAVCFQKQNECINTNQSTDNGHRKCQSAQAPLKVLESDEDSNLFKSDIENTQVRKVLAHNMCRPPMPGPRGRRRNDGTKCVIKDPMTAYIRVEKLTGYKKWTTLHVQSEVKCATPVSAQAKKSQRPYSQKQERQSNLYR
jgi:hypothetical protein